MSLLQISLLFVQALYIWLRNEREVKAFALHRVLLYKAYCGAVVGRCSEVK